MMWTVDFSSRTLKFLDKNRVNEEVLEKVRLAVKKFQGEAVSVDIRKAKGKWTGFYRIRSGKLRIIAAFDFERKNVFVDVVDWRGNVYK